MRRLNLLPFLLGVFLLYGAFSPAAPAAAACSPIANDKGQSTGTITVPTAGQYILWVRMLAPTTSNDSVYAQIDDQCPVVVNDAKNGNGFIWVSFKDAQPTESMTYTLTAGDHTIILAGREAGAGVDKVLLTADPSCVPVGTGDNCLRSTASTPTTAPAQKQTQPSVQKTTPVSPHTPNWWVIGASAIVVIAAGIFIVRRYRFHMKSLAAAGQQLGAITGNNPYEHIKISQRLVHFVQHHTLIVALWAVVTLAAVAVGIAAAADNQQVFEAEAGKLTGGATITANADASGGKYVLFQNNPAGQQGGSTSTPSANTGGGSKSGGGGTSGGGGSNTGGGSSGGGQSGGGQSGGGSTANACALPKYPNASCTGVPSGTSFSRTINGDYYANTPGQVLDAWHITGDLVIQATGIIIKNSIIDGHVDNDSLPLSTSFTITDSTVGPATCDTQGWPSLNAHDMIATRVFLRGHQDGIDLDGDNITVTDSFVQPCYQPPEVVGSDGFHSDGVQDQCGGTCGNFIFVHNTFDSRAFYNGQATGNSAIYLGSPYNGTGNNVHSLTLKDNLFLGGGYTTALWWDNVGAVTNWIISGNAWVHNSWTYGPDDSVNTCSHQTWSGNNIVTVDSNYAVTSTVSSLSCVN